MIADELSLMTLKRQWDQCYGAQELFGTVKRWLLWIVANVLQRVWRSIRRKDYLELR